MISQLLLYLVTTTTEYISSSVWSATASFIYVQQDRYKLKSTTICNTSTCCPYFSRRWPPCGYLAAVRQVMCNPYKPGVCVYSPSPYSSTAEVTASELSRWRRSRPLTFSSNSGNLPRIQYPPTAESWWCKSPRSCRKHLSLCPL